MNRRDFFKGMRETAMRAVDAGESPHPPTPAASLTGRGGEKQSSPEMRVTPGSPRQYPPGSRVLITGSLAWLCCDDLGFYAIDAHCPHLGGIVQAAEDGYACLCHDSHFDNAGRVTSGPAKRSARTRALRYLYVDLDKDGNLVIRRDRQAGPDDRLIA
jgi:Rieske Fe-S protein